MPYPGQHYARSFMTHRAALLDLLEQIPAEHGEFKAWGDGMSFRGLADHLAASAGRVSKVMLGEAPSPSEASATLEEAREKLRLGAATTHDFLAGLSGEQLAQRVKAFGGHELPASVLADFLIQHEAHHKGQVWLMARMIGVQPPLFVKLG